MVLFSVGWWNFIPLDAMSCILEGAPGVSDPIILRGAALHLPEHHKIPTENRYESKTRKKTRKCGGLSHGRHKDRCRPMSKLLLLSREHPAPVGLNRRRGMPTALFCDLCPLAKKSALTFSRNIIARIGANSNEGSRMFFFALAVWLIFLWGRGAVGERRAERETGGPSLDSPPFYVKDLPPEF